MIVIEDYCTGCGGEHVIYWCNLPRVKLQLCKKCYNLVM